MAGFNTWGTRTRKRADREHARKKAARRQRKHLESIKTPAELRRIALASRVRQK